MRSFSRRHTGPWLLLLLLICAGAVAAAPSERARILASHPHDPDAFTQGLLVADGLLYESTGGYGDSSLRRVAPASGEVLQTRSLSRDHFGEGLARVGARLYQLTWKAGVAFVYDHDSLARIDRLCEQLLGGGDPAIEDLLTGPDAAPGLERRQLRQLVRNASRANAPTARRKLFDYLRQHLL